MLGLTCLAQNRTHLEMPWGSDQGAKPTVIGVNNCSAHLTKSGVFFFQTLLFHLSISFTYLVHLSIVFIYVFIYVG